MINEERLEGTIIKAIASFYYVKSSDNVYECKARGKFKREKINPVVGDKVIFIPNTGGNVIIEVLERKNVFIRPSVANVTSVVVIATIDNPKFNSDLYNRITFLCEYYNIKINYVLNKCDIYTSEEILEFKNDILTQGYKFFTLGENKDFDSEEFKEIFKGETTMFCGASGAGKSTIINRLKGYAYMKTSEISLKVNRGKHTTRHCELIDFNGGFVLDTPGFSNLKMDFIKSNELKRYVREFEKYEDRCRFATCSHIKENDCGVKEALQDKKILESRYDSYVRLYDEIKENNRY